MEKEASAGVIVFKQDKEIKYLLLQYGLGHWGFVKGNIEKGENEKETILREAKEETGISDLQFADNFREKESYFYKREGKLISKEVIYYLAKTDAEKIRLSYEHKDFKWTDFDESIKLIKFKNEREILKKADEFLKKKVTFQKTLN